VDFGGKVWSGHEASATIRIGDMTMAHPIAIQLVEKFSCSPSGPDCEGSKQIERSYTDDGIFGILGVGLRPDPGSNLFSPLSQLPAPLDQGFTIRTGGFSSRTAHLEVGMPAWNGATGIGLKRAGTLPNGRPAWADDQVKLCFAINGRLANPHCSASILDSGSNDDVLYTRGTFKNTVGPDGALAPGATFEARRDDALDIKFKVGKPPTSSLDRVWVESTDPMSILGMETFLRYDVRYDAVHGRIGLTQHEN
jgi:hypothetical protein